jgi:hypothetical protein
MSRDVGGRDRDTQTVTVATRIERSAPAIRTFLAQHAPEERARFESEFRDAAARAAEAADLAPLEAVLDCWWGLAAMAANPLTDAERELVARAKAGDLTGLRARDEHGNWVTL